MIGFLRSGGFKGVLQPVVPPIYSPLLPKAREASLEVPRYQPLCLSGNDKRIPVG